jgi:uncharacterized protein YraI
VRTGSCRARGFPATVIATAHLRAGPSVAYPVVTNVGFGTPVTVFGCEQGYGWCDVQLAGFRGWMAAEYLQVPGPQGPVIIASAGPVMALPLITFSFNSYWDSYYRTYP